ncbi:MAG TPA: hypothetical protein VJB69_01765 [Candidatus Paceibacterota bacterium]
MIRLFTPILIIGLALVSFFYFTTPVLEEIDILKAKRLELTTALENANKLKSRQRELLDLQNAMAESDLESLRQLLPNNIDNVRLIIDINNIAKKRGLTVRNPSIAKEADPNSTSGNQPNTPAGRETLDKSSVVISFSVSSSYEVLKLFLNDLEHSLRIVDLESLSFTGNDKNNYDYKISLRTYWLK